MKKRMLGMLLAVCLLLSMLPVSALAAEEAPAVQPEVPEEAEPVAMQEDAEIPDILESSAQPVQAVSMTYVNPLYADVICASELVQPGAVALADEAEYCTTVEEAGAAVRTQLKNRQETVTVGLQDSYIDKQQLTDVFLAALVHTGIPTEGDYLAWQYGGWSGTIGGYTQNDVYYLTLTYTVTYYNTAEQEAELDAAVSELLSDLELDQKSDYETVKAIYDWICGNVTYDYTNLEDDSYNLKYTAYAALVNQTAVCQGYAVLLYRLLLEEGIDVRVITGDAGGPHAWNIVRLGGLYYNADSTWDAGRNTYSYFLKNMDNFSNHTRSSAYTTEAFNAAYPMGETDFDPNAEPPEPADVVSGTCGENLTWTLDVDGVLTISGMGEMTDFSSGEAPWYHHADKIVSVMMEDSVTSVGSFAFYGCGSLTNISIPPNVVSIGEEAFGSCGSLEAVTFSGDAPSIGSNSFDDVTAAAYYPADNSTWTADVLQNYGGTLTWTAVCAEHVWGEWTVTTEPTCTETGEKTRTCSVCGKTETSVVDALGHEFGAWYVFKAADCTVDGEKRRDCSRCDAYESQSITASGHSFNEWAVTTASACTKAGEESRTCSLCSIVETREISPLGHSYIDVVTAPTCTEQGYTIHTCTRCGDSYVDTYVGALGHDYAASVTAPTCTAQGYTTHTCTRCGSSYVDAYTNALGHQFGEWTVSKKATCTETGAETRACSACGAVETRKIAALGHDFIDGFCARCGVKLSVASGECGKNLSWTLDGDGVLTVSGTGEMADYTVGTSPWFDLRESITEIVIQDGVTRLGAYAFSDCAAVSRITFEGAAPAIGENCFRNVTAAVRYPANDATWTDSVQQGYGGEIVWAPYVEDESQGESMPMYRLYNPYTLEHLLTCSAAEANQLMSVGWLYDGVAWNSPKTGSPVYRLYNPYDDWHTYTISQEEIDMLTPLGWKVDGVVCFAASAEDGLPIYRLFNPYEQKNYHLLTASIDERDWLVTLGWKLEGIGWYAEKR